VVHDSHFIQFILRRAAFPCRFASLRYLYAMLHNYQQLPYRLDILFSSKSPSLARKKFSANQHLSADIRLDTADELLQLEEVGGELDVVLEVLLGVKAELAGVGLVLLDVQTDGGAAGTGAGETDDDAAAVVELDVDALVLADAAVEVGVGEVVGLDDLAASDGGADELALLGADELVDVGDHLSGISAVAALVVVAGEERAAVDAPEVLLDALDAGSGASLLANAGNDVQPGDDSPETVLLADVVGAGTERLLTADAHLLGVEETAEELPASGDLV
jgi:hypothetical protein